ncbi:MAG: hypothetical protein Q4A32_10925 [Lachnospiraceae bacterium]|nr:hypothetical protein [Lachnospiraceae bacterium]
MKEIGGYLEFENFGGREYHPGCLKLNLGRCAAAWFLNQAGCRTLYYPWFICASVTDALTAAGIHLKRYRIRPDFRPEEADLPEALGDDEWIFINNAYGQLTNSELAAYKQRFTRILVDNTHAFFQKPADGAATLYSVRKFLGVTDGAYLYTDRDMDGPEETDMSHGRFAHILGRYEVDAGTFYQQMLANAHSYEGAAPAKMSPLTENILGGLDYDRIAERRMTNYLALREHLANYNELEMSGHLRIPDIGPFVYPMLVSGGAALRKRLAAEKIFVPTYWSDLAEGAPSGSVERRYASDILALPCDQRYDEEDMRRVAQAVLA